MSKSHIHPDTILVEAPARATRGFLHFAGATYPCALGRSGIVTAKCEGDGGTPVGTFPLRTLRFRADRLARPQSAIEAQALEPHDGWCDAPDDPAYNQYVTRPYLASSETLWRDDLLYDIVIMLGYNDAPVIAGKGSAIFFHLAKQKDGLLQPTEGCVALQLDDMIRLLKQITPATLMTIRLMA